MPSSPPPFPLDEAQRMDALRRYGVLDTAPEEAFERLTRLAARVCRTPIALVTLVDDDRQWFKSMIGMSVRETPRAFAFCAHTILSDDLTIVPDALRDPRFADSPLVTGEPHVRFYAGAPLRVPGGQRVGSLAVLDRVPRTLTEEERAALRDLAGIAVDELELRLRAERARRVEQRSASILGGIFASASLAVYTLDRDGHVTSWNAAAERIFGWSTDEVLGRPPPMLDADERQGVRGLVERVLDGEVRRSVHRRRRKDGTHVDVLVTASPLVDAAGRAWGVLAVAEDWTALRDTESALARVEQSFRELVDKCPDGVLVHRDGRIVYANEALGAILRRRSEEIVGRSPIDLVHPVDRALVADRIAHLCATGRATSLRQIRMVRHDGSEAVVEAVGVPVTFDGARSTATIVRDITERRDLERQLLVADRMSSIGMVAAGVAHEINNPLAYVMTNLEYVQQAAAQPDPSAHVLAQVHDAARDALEGCMRVRGIVGDLRMLSRDDERFAPVDVERVLSSAAQVASLELRRRATLVKDFGGVPSVLGNEGRLGQVFLNLIVNAAHAIAPGDPAHNEVRLVTRVEEGNVVVEVRDTGAGIPPEVASRLFNAFFTTKERGQGTGLGLSICQSIVRAHHGTITFDSTPGEGTVFRVRLPATASRERIVAAGTRAARRRARPRLLVIDDEPRVGLALRRALEREADVVTTADAGAALDRVARGERFDVVLCDVTMPGMSGPALQAQLRERAPDQADALVFAAGAVHDPDVRRFLETARHLEKPVDVGALRALLRERARLRRDGAADALDRTDAEDAEEEEDAEDAEDAEREEEEREREERRIDDGDGAEQGASDAAEPARRAGGSP